MKIGDIYQINSTALCVVQSIRLPMSCWLAEAKVTTTATQPGAGTTIDWGSASRTATPPRANDLGAGSDSWAAAFDSMGIASKVAPANETSGLALSEKSTSTISWASFDAVCCGLFVGGGGIFQVSFSQGFYTWIAVSHIIAIVKLNVIFFHRD